MPLCRELGIGLVAYSPLGRQANAGRATARAASGQQRALLPTACFDNRGSSAERGPDH